MQAIQELMKIHGQDPVSFQDVKVSLLRTYITTDNITMIIMLYPIYMKVICEL